MTYTTVYDFANDSIGSIGLQFPLLGLAFILVGAALKWLFKKSGRWCYPIMGIGIVTLFASGALPWWDHDRIARAVANGEARQVEGPIGNWRLQRARSGKTGTTTRYGYTYYERFSVGGVDFDVEWDSLEAGFANRGSTEGHPAVRLTNGMEARIWYVPVDRLGKPRRIVRLDLAPGGSHAGSQDRSRSLPGAAAPPQERITDTANILAAEQKVQLDAVLSRFERMSGHPFVIVTVPTLGGQDIARYAADLGNRRGVGRQGQDDGIVLLVAPRERQVRIAVGRGLEASLSDATCQEILDVAVLPMFRRGDMPGGIEAGVSMIVDAVMSRKAR